MKKSKIFKRKVGILMLTLFFLFLVFCYALYRARPIIDANARLFSKNRATAIINESVRDVVKSEGIKYSDIITVTSDAEGNVKFLSVDSGTVNLVKSLVALEITDALCGKWQEFKVPLGSLSGLFILEGRGPSVSVRILAAEGAVTLLKSSVEEFGINQSRHKIEMEIEIDVTVTMLLKAQTVTVRDSVLIADTIIVGKVPDAYTALNKLSGDDVGDVIDFMAGEN